MPCGCGRSYIVNESFGSSSRKDTSFKSFIRFLLIVLLLCIAIYCIILTVNGRKNANLQKSDASNENLQGEIERTKTENSSISIKNITEYYTSLIQHDHTEATTKSLEILHTNFNEITETQNVTTISNKMNTTTEIVDLVKLFSSHLETSTTNVVQITTTYPNNIREHYQQNTAVVDLDSSTTSNKPFTEYLTFTTTQPTSQEFLLTTDIDTYTELDEDDMSQENDDSIGPFIEKQSTVDFSTETIGTQSTAQHTHFLKDKSISTNTPVSETTIDITSETENSQWITESEVKKNSVQPNSWYYYVKTVEEPTTTENNVQVNTEDNDFQSSSENVIMSTQYTPHSTFLYNSEKRLQETTLPDFINKEISTSFIELETSQNVFDATTDKIKDQTKKEHKAVKLQNRVQKFTDDDSKINEKEKVCTAATCKKKTSQILQFMGHSVDPCEDFYQFSCGEIKNDDDAEKVRYSDVLLKHVFTFFNSDDKYLKSFRKFFSSCIKYEIEFGYSTKIKQVLSSNVRDSNLTSLLSFLMLRQSTPLFEIRYGFVGGKEGYGMQILPPDSNYKTTGLKGWSLQSQINKQCLNFDPKLKYQSDVKLPTVYKDYNKCKYTTFKRMAENFVMEKLDRTKDPNKAVLRNFLSFFSIMNTVSGPTLQDAILNQKYTETNVGSLNQKYPQIDWQDFFKIITGKKIETSTNIFLYLEQEYFEQIMSDLKDRMLKTEKQVIETLKLYYQLELYQNLLAHKENKEEFCMKQAVELMPEVATKIFHEVSGLKAFRNSLVENNFKDLKDKFYWLIEVSHLEEVNKKRYKDSLDKVTLKMFENNAEWEKYLEESYDSVYLTDDYLSNLFMFVENKRRTRNAFRSDDEGFIFTQFLDRQFFQTPESIPNTNVIAIPNMFLYKLYKSQELPVYIFESYLKFHLSRALALHLSNIDQEPKSPFYRQYLNSLNSYLENGDDMKTLKEQHISFQLEYTLWPQVVRFSEATRMADNIALDMAFKDIYILNKTFERLPWIPREYSPQHQFFILIAQEYCENPTLAALARNLYESPHIPSIFRIENMIMNSKSFSQTFECPQGTPMNPEDKTQFDTFFNENNYIEYDQINK